MLLHFNNLTIMLEFKFAQKSSLVPKMRAEGIQQINDREYAKSYASGGRKVITAVLVADDEKRQLVIAL